MNGCHKKEASGKGIGDPSMWRSEGGDAKRRMGGKQNRMGGLKNTTAIAREKNLPGPKKGDWNTKPREKGP